jgi:hypothetical protein
VSTYKIPLSGAAVFFAGIMDATKETGNRRTERGGTQGDEYDRRTTAMTERQQMRGGR